MLRRLDAALGEWTPQEQSRWANDPLVLLAAGWSEIVGEDVARNSRPARIAGDTLLIATRSGAWSQQLGFLAESVLAAVRARLPQTAVTQLRFKVGTIPAPTPAAPLAAASPEATRGAHVPAASADEAVARFRQAVEERRRAKRLAGWKECAGCGALIAPRGSWCIPCANDRAQRRAAAVAQLLFEAPWLGYAGTAELIEGLTSAEYRSIRTRLLSRWWETLSRACASKRLSKDRRERLIASSYVLLKTKLAPEAVEPATVRNVLGDELNELIYGTEQQTKTYVQ